MPWQAHLFVGQGVRTYSDVRLIFGKLGVEKERMDIADWAVGEIVVKRQLTVGEVKIRFVFEAESGDSFPVPRNAPINAFVGFPLTSRYKGAILDRKFPNGRPEPFRLDLVEIQLILDQVRVWWPEAEILMYEIFH